MRDVLAARWAAHRALPVAEREAIDADRFVPVDELARILARYDAGLFTLDDGRARRRNCRRAEGRDLWRYPAP